MLKWIEATGRSEEAAIQNALAQLGLDRDSVSVEVLERARNGFLGFGSSPAKVKVTYEVSQEEAPVSPVEEIFAPAPQPKPAATPARPAEAAPKGPAKAEAPASPVPGAKPGDLEERIRAFLSGLLAHMGVEAAIHVSPKGDNGILVTLEGPKLGALIGHRGETLDAIQQLTSTRSTGAGPTGCGFTLTRSTTGPSGRNPSSAWPIKLPSKWSNTAGISPWSP